MEISVHNEMKMLFNTAYHVALHEMPFTAFPGLCALQNGLNKIGETYMNDKAASTFISYIADMMIQDLQFINISFKC